MISNYQSLTELASEIERQEQAVEDYIVPNANLQMTDDQHLQIGDQEKLAINPVAHTQIANKLNIPFAYYKRMSEVPGLRAANVNAWLKHSQEDRHMIRTLDNRARAFLSDRFRPLDNFLILSAFLPVLKDHSELEIMSKSLTERKLYLQFKFPKLQAEVSKGDAVQAGVILTNSEVGLGAVDIKTMVWRLVCENGMIRESVLKRYHLGRKIQAEEDYSIYQDDTLQADFSAFKLKIRDAMRAALDSASFQDTVLKLQQANEDEIENIPRTVERVTKRFSLTESDGEGIIQNMVSNAKPTRWTLANGITALAKEVESPDRSYELERTGSKIIDLKKKEWKELSV